MAVLGVASSQAINLRDDADDTASQTLAKSKQFDPVGRLTIDRANAIAHGTATFIGFGKGKGWIVTAAHVLSGYRVKDSKFAVNGKEFGLADGYSLFGDLAVIALTDVKAGDIPVAKFLANPVPTPTDLAKRTIGTGIGFGYSGTGTKPGTVDDGKKRAFTNRIDAYYASRVDGDGKPVQTFKGYLTDFDSGKKEGNALQHDDVSLNWPKTQTSSRDMEPMEGGIDSGDSGGPIMVESEWGWAVAGVASSSMLGTGYGSMSFYESMDAKTTAWMTEKTGITPVPEPASLVALTLGFGVLARKGGASRRR